jgi:hypothetical protein
MADSSEEFTWLLRHSMSDNLAPLRQEVGMRTSWWERFAALCGALFVVFFVAGFALQGTGAPSADTPPADVVASYSGSGTELEKELGATFVGFAIFFLLIFLGRLHRSLRRAEEDRLFSSSALAGGIAMAVFLGVSAAFGTAVVSAEGFYAAFEVDANTVLAFSTLWYWFLGFSLVGAAVLIGSASLVAWRTGLFPRWVAIGGFVVAALGFFGETTAVFVVPFILLAAWLLVASVMLARREPGSAPS